MKIAIVGAGAAGMFCAANLKAGFEIEVLEQSGGVLRKVEQSGGGRCNITNAQKNVSEFIKAYPRGGKSLRKPLMRFGNSALEEWFLKKGVKFKTEGDGRVFPESDDSLTIVNCLHSEARKNGATIRKNFSAKNFSKMPDGKYMLSSQDGNAVIADAVLFATGGCWNADLKSALERMSHKFAEPLPSLFGFKAEGLEELAGLSLRDACLKCPEFGFETSGDILFTHEGMTGPAVLKMSSLGARVFAAKGYKLDFSLSVLKNPESFDLFCKEARAKHSKKLAKNFRHPEIPQKYWEFLLEKSGISGELEWAHFSKENQKSLRSNIMSLNARTTAKAANTREFVTSGGLELDCVDLNTMQSKFLPNVFFAGECLNIDAFTGGYNLQAAWTTSFIAASSINSLK